MLFQPSQGLIQRLGTRVFRGLLFSSLLLAGITGFSVGAQASIYAESSVVLVLKLISATRVQPTTGVVVSSDGLVIVSADFVSDGAEIVIMDGGVSIQTYARPAKLVSLDEETGVALLSVDGLSRQPILRSILVSPSDGDLHLAAFPPGEQIASGDSPLWVPVDVAPAAGSNQWRVINSTDLPNVSGPILDSCGFLAGLNLADGAQSMSGGQATSVIGAPMLSALKNLGVQLSTASCDTSAGSQRGNDDPMTEAELAQARREPASVVKEMPRIFDDPKTKKKPVIIDEVAEQRIGKDDASSNNANQTSAAAGAGRTSPSLWSLIPWWLWLAIVLVLAATLFKLGALWRLVNKSEPPAAAHTPRQAPVVEPPTIDLLIGHSDRASHGLAGYAVAKDQMPDISQLPDGFDAVICVSGELSDGSAFTRYCIADKAHIDMIIGRGDADISIESPTVSRQHARLKGTVKALTLSDLDSNNGTFMGEVPCLPGEIMFVGPGDEVTLGDVRFKITVKYKIERMS